MREALVSFWKNVGIFIGMLMIAGLGIFATAALDHMEGAQAAQAMADTCRYEDVKILGMMYLFVAGFGLGWLVGLIHRGRK